MHHREYFLVSSFFFIYFFGCWRFTGFHHMSGRIFEVRWEWSAPHIKWIPIKCILASFFSLLSFPPTLTVLPPPLSKSFYPPRQKISASPSVSVRGLSYVRVHREEIRQRVALKGSSVFVPYSLLFSPPRVTRASSEYWTTRRGYLCLCLLSLSRHINFCGGGRPESLLPSA